MADLLRRPPGDSDSQPHRLAVGFPHGAAMVDRAAMVGGVDRADQAAGRAFVLVDDGWLHALGPALVWAHNSGASEVHLLVEGGSAASLLARRSSLFSVPATIWLVAGRELSRAVSVDPAARLDAPSCASELEALAVAHDLRLVLEHGVLGAELLGLEVARASQRDGQCVIEVGVGHHDRQAREELSMAQFGATEPGVAGALAEVVPVVRRWRRANTQSHPANQLSRERWLRSVLMAEPGLVGASALEPLAPPMARGSLLERSPAAAIGSDPDGSPVVVLCSTGIDLDLVPTAADTRLAAGGRAGSARLVLFMPPGDDHQATRQLAGALTDPAEVVVAPSDWATMPGQ